MNTRAKFLVVLPSTCLMALLLFGGLIGPHASAAGASDNTDVFRHLSVYSEVLSYIKNDYVEEPDIPSVTLGALNGLLESIDPYASYLNAKQYQEYLKSSDAYRGELGLTLAKKYGYITIMAVLPGTPADKAGLTSGDFIESIKGVATRDMPLAYASLLLRGEPGSDVELSVLRRKPEPQKMTLTRAVVSIPAVQSKMLADSIGYIKIPALGTGKVQEVATAVNALQKQGAKKLVLDLRLCAIGDPENGIELANLFAGQGLIGFVQGQKYSRHDFTADPKKAISSLPLVILTNRGTGGAAEVATVGLQALKRASVVGEPTVPASIGDAAIRKAITMDDGSAVILSVAKYYPPNGEVGKAIQDNGVKPDATVLDPGFGPDDDGDDDAPATNATPAKKPSGDVMLDKAIDVAKNGVPAAPDAQQNRGPNVDLPRTTK